MGCGTWGGNGISDNVGYRHFLNVTRVVRPFAPERIYEPTEDELFGRLSRETWRVTVVRGAAGRPSPVARASVGTLPDTFRAVIDGHASTQPTEPFLIAP
jgi:hypothetical protein